MKHLLSKAGYHLEQLNQSIYTGDKYEKNLNTIGWFGLICAIFGTGMSVLNVVQHKGFVTWTTILFAVGGIVVLIAARVFRSRGLVVNSFAFMSMVIFSYYAISGTNEGFAILWTLLMPLAICYFMSVKHGIMVSLYFEILIVLLFYTPLRNHYDGVYTVTFMNRFPVVYLCEVMITAVCMTQYHESVLVEMKYTERLNAEVEKQTKVATEQTKVAMERADELERLTDEMVETLARAIDAKDEYTNGHSFRVSEYAVKLATALGWDEAEVRALEREALLHDIGKIGIPDAVLKKPGKLTGEEFETIKSHTSIGKKILEGMGDMNAAAQAAAYHHERYDGKGYPEGLKGTEIPLHARVISIADAYDAMSSDRVYRKRMTRERIREELLRGAGTQFDPEFLPVFVELMDKGKLDREVAAAG